KNNINGKMITIPTYIFTAGIGTKWKSFESFIPIFKESFTENFSAVEFQTFILGSKKVGRNNYLIKEVPTSSIGNTTLLGWHQHRSHWIKQTINNQMVLYTLRIW